MRQAILAVFACAALCGCGATTTPDLVSLVKTPEPASTTEAVVQGCNRVVADGAGMLLVSGPGSDQECAALTNSGVLWSHLRTLQSGMQDDPLDPAANDARWKLVCSLVWPTGLRVDLRQDGPPLPQSAVLCAQLSKSAGVRVLLAPAVQ